MICPRKYIFSPCFCYTVFIHQVLKGLSLDKRRSPVGNFSEGYYYVDKQYSNEFGRIKESASRSIFFSKSIVFAPVGGGGRGRLSCLILVLTVIFRWWPLTNLSSWNRLLGYGVELDGRQLRRKNMIPAVAAENLKFIGEPVYGNLLKVSLCQCLAFSAWLA